MLSGELRNSRIRNDQNASRHVCERALVEQRFHRRGNGDVASDATSAADSYVCTASEPFLNVRRSGARSRGMSLVAVGCHGKRVGDGGARSSAAFAACVDEDTYVAKHGNGARSRLADDRSDDDGRLARARRVRRERARHVRRDEYASGARAASFTGGTPCQAREARCGVSADNAC